MANQSVFHINYITSSILEEMKYPIEHGPKTASLEIQQRLDQRGAQRLSKKAEQVCATMISDNSGNFMKQLLLKKVSNKERHQQDTKITTQEKYSKTKTKGRKSGARLEVDFTHYPVLDF